MNYFASIDASVYEAQLAAKTGPLSASFRRLFGAPEPEIFRSDPVNYRMRAKFAVRTDGDRVRYCMTGTEGNRKTRIFLEAFPAGSELMNRLMPVLAGLLSGNEPLCARLFEADFLTTLSGEALITLQYHKKLGGDWIEAARALLAALRGAFPDNAVDVVGRARGQKIVLDRDFVRERLTVDGEPLLYRQNENSFTQPNARVCEKMLAWTRRGARGLEDSDLLELYCGNGNFSVALARRFRKILATEISQSGAAAARINAALNGADNLKVVRMSAEEIAAALNGAREFRRMREAGADPADYSFGAALVDPPRAGLDPATVGLLGRFGTIIYISCCPATLTENLKELVKTHRVEKIAFFDQFPYTEEHIETGVILKRNGR